MEIYEVTGEIFTKETREDREKPISEHKLIKDECTLFKRTIICPISDMSEVYKLWLYEEFKAKTDKEAWEKFGWCASAITRIGSGLFVNPEHEE